MKVAVFNALQPDIFHKILLAMFIAAVLPLAAVWYVNYQNSLNYISAAVDRHLSGVSDDLVAHVDDWFAMNARMLRQNAGLRDIVGMRARAQAPVLRAISREYIWSYLVFTIGPDGKNIARSDDKPLIDYSDRSYFRQVMDGASLGRQFVISKTTGKPSLILSVPIYRADKSIAGVLAMGMSIADLAERVTNVHIGNTGYALLLDQDGNIVAHQPQANAKPAAGTGAFPHAVDAAAKRRIVFEEDGRKIIAYAQKTAHGWTMVVRQDYAEAFASLAEANRNALILLIITLFGAAVLAFAMSQRLSRPIQNLTRAAEEISRGNFGVEIPETERRDEIGALAGAIDRMSVSIRLAIDRLKRQA